ncbi:MAG: PD-(D/E)XK nuclease family protein [Chloroflexota bacterium]
MNRISPLKVRVFGACRLRYRYQYVDRQEGRVRPRLRPADTAGSLVHRVLCDFFSKVEERERTRDKLFDMFNVGWNALSEGYHRVPGVEVHHENSLRQLSNFVRLSSPRGSGPRPDTGRGLGARPFMVEPYFQTEIEPGILLFGRVDRLDEEQDGALHIIDYKGGAEPEEIDPSQLVLYAILVEAKLDRTVSKASFWYLDDGQTWTMEFRDDDKRRAREELLATAREMEAVSDFPPTIGPHCAFCPYLKVCDVRKQIAEVRAPGGW